ncbi:hypothetical protein SHIRM173S_09754 [Streptomyces hirsutus]
MTERPLHARVAADNAGSLRVLEKCGFRVVARETGYAPARGAETDELVLTSASAPAALRTAFTERPVDRNPVPGDQFVKALNLSGPPAV